MFNPDTRVQPGQLPQYEYRSIYSLRQLVQWADKPSGGVCIRPCVRVRYYIDENYNRYIDVDIGYNEKTRYIDLDQLKYYAKLSVHDGRLYLVRWYNQAWVSEVAKHEETSPEYVHIIPRNVEPYMTCPADYHKDAMTVVWEGGETGNIPKDEYGNKALCCMYKEGVTYSGMQYSWPYLNAKQGKEHRDFLPYGICPTAIYAEDNHYFPRYNDTVFAVCRPLSFLEGENQVYQCRGRHRLEPWTKYRLGFSAGDQLEMCYARNVDITDVVYADGILMGTLMLIRGQCRNSDPDTVAVAHYPVMYKETVSVMTDFITQGSAATEPEDQQSMFTGIYGYYHELIVHKGTKETGPLSPEECAYLETEMDDYYAILNRTNRKLSYTLSTVNFDAEAGKLVVEVTGDGAEHFAVSKNRHETSFFVDNMPVKMIEFDPEKEDITSVTVHIRYGPLQPGKHSAVITNYPEHMPAVTTASVLVAGVCKQRQ